MFQLSCSYSLAFAAFSCSFAFTVLLQHSSSWCLVLTVLFLPFVPAALSLQSCFYSSVPVLVFFLSCSYSLVFTILFTQFYFWVELQQSFYYSSILQFCSHRLVPTILYLLSCSCSLALQSCSCTILLICSYSLCSCGLVLNFAFAVLFLQSCSCSLAFTVMFLHYLSSYLVLALLFLAVLFLQSCFYNLVHTVLFLQFCLNSLFPLNQNWYIENIIAHNENRKLYIENKSSDKTIKYKLKVN